MSNELPDIGDVITAKIDGVNVRCARSGKPDGIPVLLTSPWPESIYAFRQVLPAINAGSPVIAVDLPGFGRSESRPDLMSPVGMGDFVVKLAAHFGIERMHAVGPDVGTLALLFASVRKPALFVSLVVGSGAASVELVGGGLKDLIGSPAGYFANTDGGDVAVKFVTDSAAVMTPKAVLEDYRLSSAGRRFEEATNFVRAYPRDLPRLKTHLPYIKTPILILAGSHDPIVPPSNGQFLADLLPRCRNTLLEGGHLIWEDAAAAYASNVVEWIGGGYQSV